MIGSGLKTHLFLHYWPACGWIVGAIRVILGLNLSLHTQVFYVPGVARLSRLSRPVPVPAMELRISVSDCRLRRL